MAQSTALPVIDISRSRAPDADCDAFLAELRSTAHEVDFFHACGTGATDDPANAGPSGQNAEFTAIDTGATVDVRLVLEPTSPDILRLAKNATYDLFRRFANDDRTVTGTPRQIADPLEEWFHGRAAGGFIANFPYLPGSPDAFAEVRRRSLFRTHCTGRALRDHLGLPRPSRRA
ncbi:hypothetical protein [Streptomyces canus]|uniref:hypothetical protein n=1 Tax=Streptomyces canus TaxID=58343 RepID=UPI00277E461D|nr:hypothetical protein [Streptomyces canus]MDQ0766873.1 alkanesulfonate monooxygenase SsuD/methylene tetrahydromethanopterin reductase-like flavin-dependent oxidoreductase (luciferase family) [Streptomyces canus]